MLLCKLCDTCGEDGNLKNQVGKEQEMGAITCVPREVVPPVNHSPGFAVLRGSGVLSQVDIPSSWGLPGLTAAGERKRTVLVPPTSLLGSLPPSFGEQGG